MAHGHTDRKLTPLEIIKRAIFIALGASVFSFGLNGFLLPNGMLDGGLVGVSIILSHLTGLGLGIILFVLHIPFIYLGYKQLGKTFAFSTLFGVAIVSILSSLLHHMDPVTTSPLLDVIFGGAFMGVGVGMAIRWGGCLDGTEILAIMFSRNLPFSVGEIMMVINAIIFTWAGFVFSWESAMYSIVAYFIASKAIDVTVEGFDEMREAWIISDKHEEMGQALMARLGRSVTYLPADGGFSGEGKRIVVCYFARLEEAKLKTVIDEIDSKALLKVSHVSELRGGRFKKENIH